VIPVRPCSKSSAGKRSDADTDIDGKPHPDRSWKECFAQLVGTVLSVWDAASLDHAGDEGEVVPTFINITDGSIKIVRSPISVLRT
jgi:CCR4-NOT transcriptional complex subunit CAF120